MKFKVSLRERIPELMAFNATTRRGYVKKAMAAALKKTQAGLKAEITEIMKEETTLGESKIRKRIKRHPLKRDANTISGTIEITGKSVGLSDYPKKRMTIPAPRVRKRRVKRKSGKWVNTSKMRLKGVKVQIKPGRGFVPLSKKMFPLKAKKGSKYYIAMRDPNDKDDFLFPMSTSPVDVFAENRGKHRQRILEKAKARFTKEVDQFLYADMRGFIVRRKKSRKRKSRAKSPSRS